MDLFAACFALIHTPERNLSPSELLQVQNNNVGPSIPREQVNQILNHLVDEYVKTCVLFTFSTPLDFVMEALLRLMNVASEASVRLQKQQTTSKELEAAKRTISNLLSRCMRKKEGVSLILGMLLKDQANNSKCFLQKTHTSFLSALSACSSACHSCSKASKVQRGL